MSEVPDNIIAKRHRYAALDGMRGIAAITVMVYHLTQHTSFIEQSEYPVLANAALAVDFFFILSGFVLTHSYGARLIGGGMSGGEYIKRRLIRIYPMFLLGLIIGAPALLFLTANNFANYSPKSIVASFIYNAVYLPFFSTLKVMNMGAGRPTVGELFPANPPAWSLFFEMIASGALLILLKLKPKSLLRFTIYSYVALVINGLIIMELSNAPTFDWAQGWSITNFMGGFARVFFGFSAGIVIYHAVQDEYSCFVLRRVTKHLVRNSIVLYGLLMLALACPLTMSGIYPLFILAVVLPALVFMGANIECAGLGLKLARLLGWLSYPVYCLHFPIGRWAFFMDRDSDTPASITILIAIAATLVASVVLAKIVEEPLRRVFTRRLSGGVA